MQVKLNVIVGAAALMLGGSVYAQDVVVKIGGLEITNQADLRNAMLRYAPGEKVSVEVVREKRRQTFQVKLIEAPKRVAQAPIQNDPTDGSDGSNPLDQLPDGFNVPDLGNQLPKSNGETDQVPPLREGKAQLGVQVENIGATHRAQFHIPSDAEGVVIVSVQPGSVADKAGFKIGDVLQGIGSVNIKSVEDVTKAMADLKWGMMTNVRYSRFGENARMTNSIPVKFQ